MEAFLKNENIVIEIIDNDEKLIALANILQGKEEIAFDTEFDRFKRTYGFNLCLIQVYDGSRVYIIDPIKIESLLALWKVFENPDICKVLYSCQEDIALLTINGCRPKNIFDVQIAAQLCDHPSKSFAQLIELEFKKIDKSKQKSDWNKRPLDFEQLIYSTNDVIYLLTLKEKFHKQIISKGMQEMLDEENFLCENPVITNYKPKLSKKQIQQYSPYFQEILLKLFKVRDKIAQELNVPPFYVVSDSTIEGIIKDKGEFLTGLNFKGFHWGIKTNQDYVNMFLEIIKDIDYSNEIHKTKTLNKNIIRDHSEITDEIIKADILAKYELIKKEVYSIYGENSGDFILRGLRKELLSKNNTSGNLRPYQYKVLGEISKKLNLKIR